MRAANKQKKDIYLLYLLLFPWCLAPYLYRLVKYNNNNNNRVGCSDRVSNLEVRKYVLGGNRSDTLFWRIKLCRLRWLGHVLRMELHRLPYQALFSMPQTR